MQGTVLHNNPESTKGIIISHHGIKGQKWGVRRYQNKEISNFYKSETERLYKSEPYVSMSKQASKARDEALSLVRKYGLDPDDGGGGKPGTPSGTGEKYLKLSNKAMDIDSNIHSKIKSDVNKSAIKKYGAERIRSYNTVNNIKTGAQITATVLASAGSMILIGEGIKAIGKGAAKVVKKGANAVAAMAKKKIGG